MSFEPQRFFVGLVDFFSVLMPGGLLAYLGKDWAAPALFSQPVYKLEGFEAWAVFLFVSYLLGHFLFLFGSGIDVIYDRLRNCTNAGQIARLAKGKPFNFRMWRWIATKIFGEHADRAMTQAVRLKARTLQGLLPSDTLNAFQWCKARLSKDHPEGLTSVQRFEADSKFFRSFAVVLFGVIPFFLWHDHKTIAWVCAGGVFLSMWRYADQRFKATQQAYWLVLTLESLKTSPATTNQRMLREDGATHAGGVVFRSCDGTVKFLLVEAGKDRTEWVLPKGHIEFGENPCETAVREIREETGCWARVVRWIRHGHFPNNGSTIVSKFYLMEFVEGRSKAENENKSIAEDSPQEDWRHEWLELAAAKEKTKFNETRQLLDLADKVRLKMAQQKE